jgi:predicted dehydrogenase
MSFNRREFLRKSGVIVAGAASVSGISTPYFFTNTAFADDGDKKKHKIGCIGTGSRWHAVGREAMKFGEVLAVCDVDKKHCEEANKIVGGKAEMHEDYHRVLDNPNIDVVTIVTPDHWHSKIAIEAMKAGKHVYCEKPLTLTIDEGKLISKVQKDTGKVFQVGTQQRSEMSGVDENKVRYKMQFLQAVGLAHSGRLGKIKKLHCFIGSGPSCDPIAKADVPKELNWEMWLGQAPMTDFIFDKKGKGDAGQGSTRCHYEFRWWFEYSGGKMTDWGAHHVDIATWLIDMGNSGPIKIEPIMAKFPVKMKNGMPTENNRYNTANEFEIKCTYANGIELFIHNDPPEGMKVPEANGIYVEAEKSNLFVSRSKLMGDAAKALKENPLPEELLTKLYKGKKPGKGHMDNFFECINNGGEPVSDVHTHHRAMTTCHLANIAIRLNRPLKWDPEKEEIVGDSEAFAMQSREQRKGYEITA